MTEELDVMTAADRIQKLMKLLPASKSEPLAWSLVAGFIRMAMIETIRHAADKEIEKQAQGRNLNAS